MRSTAYRFDFDESASMADVETTLHLAILGAEGLFGEAVVLMDGAYSIDEERRSCVVDAGSEVGRAIVKLFTGYLTKELGPDVFRVRNAERDRQSIDQHAERP